MHNEKDIYYFKNVFRESYSVNPKKTLDNMEMCLLELGYEVENMKSIKTKLFLSKEINQILILTVLLCLFGSFLSKFIPLFLAGMAFFMGGLFINLGLKGDKALLIFLFSHGLIGLVLIVSSFLIPPNVSFSELNLDKIMIYLFLGMAFCIVGFIRTVLYVLSDNFYKMPYARCRIFVYYLIGILTIGIASYIFRM